MEHSNGKHTSGNYTRGGHKNAEHTPEKPKYIDFPYLEHGSLLDGKLALNRWSHTITKGHDFPGAQVRIYKCQWKMEDGR